MTIGFMQGRLSTPLDGRIQAFPWSEWRDEFPRAQRLQFPLMEWTLDADRLDENPLMTAAGRAEIQQLCDRHGVTVSSVTGDFLMQSPPFAVAGAAREARLEALERVVSACGALGVEWLVWPLVDSGRIGTPEAEAAIVETVSGRLAPALRRNGVRIAFESDYAPPALAAFIRRFPPHLAGVNYDIGNSASLGYRADEELAAYGDRVVNVHVKDRVRGGTTVPLGEGDADLPAAFAALARAGYRGHYILQAARAANGDHAGALERYRAFALRAMGHA